MKQEETGNERKLLMITGLALACVAALLLTACGAEPPAPAARTCDDVENRLRDAYATEQERSWELDVEAMPFRDYAEYLFRPDGDPEFRRVFGEHSNKQFVSRCWLDRTP